MPDRDAQSTGWRVFSIPAAPAHGRDERDVAPSRGKPGSMLGKLRWSGQQGAKSDSTGAGPRAKAASPSYVLAVDDGATSLYIHSSEALLHARLAALAASRKLTWTI